MAIAAAKILKMTSLSRLRRILVRPFEYYNDILQRRPLPTKIVTTGLMFAGGDILAQYTEHYVEEKDKKERKEMIVDYKRMTIFFIFGTVLAGPSFHYWYNYLNEIPTLLWSLKKFRQRGRILKAYTYLKSHGIEVKLDHSKLPKTAPLGKLQTKFIKMILDQTVFAPIFLVSLFISVGLMEKISEKFYMLYLLDDDDKNTSGTVDPYLEEVLVKLEDHLNETNNARWLDQYTKRMIKQLHRAQAIEENNLSWKNIWFDSVNHMKQVFFPTYLMDCLIWPPLQFINFTFVPVQFQFLFVNTATLIYNIFLSFVANKKNEEKVEILQEKLNIADTEKMLKSVKNLK